jgi:hypothetical protein
MAQTVQYQIKGGTLTFVVEPQALGYVLVTVRHGAFSITAKGDPMAYTLPADMLVNVQVAYVDAHGNPAAVDGEVTWASSADSIVTVTVDPGDSTIARVSAAGALGQAQIAATADADLGDGTREIITIMDVTVVAGEAVAGTITPVGEAQPSAPHVEPRRR